MVNGHYSSFTTHRCGICNKFFNTGKQIWVVDITCPHCLNVLSPEPCTDYIAYSGLNPIQGGLFSYINFKPSGVY